jgi:TolB-like protein/Flp pilus assembly protein TadD
MRFLFGDYALDIARRELHRGGEPVSLEPQVFDVLAHLLLHRDRVVSKDELIEQVWHGRIVSDTTIDGRIKFARRAIGDSGVAQALIRTLPRKGVRFVGKAFEEGKAALLPGPTVLDAAIHQTQVRLPPDKPSIAVLPFANLSSEPEQDYFADGMVQDITTAISRVRWLFVIARNSSFTYKGRAVDVRQVGRELGVKYVLEGSVRKVGDHVRISTELLETATGGHVWADQYDRKIEDVFALQDEITEAVVGALVPNLRLAEIDQAKRQRASDLNAYDLYLRALPHYYAVTREGYHEAMRLLRKSLELEPDYAAALALTAACISYGMPCQLHHRVVQLLAVRGRLAGWGGSAEEAVRLARRAIALDKNDAEALAICGYTLAFQGEPLDEAISSVNQATHLDPNSAFCWIHSGWVHMLAAQPVKALENLRRASRLSPFDPLKSIILGGMANSLIQLDRSDEAIAAAAEATRLSPDNSSAWRALTASLVLADRVEEARTAGQHILKLEPDFTLRNWNRRTGGARQVMLKLTELLRQSGLPE